MLESPTAGLWPAWVWIWEYGLLFALIHSGMATASFKSRVHRHMKHHQYRLLYSVIGLITTGLWLALVHLLPDQPLYHIQGAGFWIAIIIQIVAGVFLLLTLRSFDGAAFLGLKASSAKIDSFHVSGLYRYVRHPMYSAVMLLMLASPVQSVNSLHLTLAVCLYFIVGSWLEERRMCQLFPEYRNYQRQTPAFIPMPGRTT